MPTHAQQQNASQQENTSKATRPAPMEIGQLGFEASEILNLQHSVGNHAVQRMLDTSPNGLAISQMGNPAILRDPDDDEEAEEEEEQTPVPLTALTVDHPRVTVPPEAGLSFNAVKTPSDATNVNLTLTGDGAAIAGGTSIDSDTGAITVGADQTGGGAQVEAEQTVPREDGGENIISANAPFAFTGVPSGIASTSSGASGSYGGQFTHTFGGGSALELSHVNEQFPAASGTTLELTSDLGDLEVHVNPPDDAGAGWDLDSSGTMAGPDNVTWSDTYSARPFIRNASNPSPSSTLPQAFTATQNFRNLSYPSRTYGDPVATTTHRRAIEVRGDELKAITSAAGPPVEQDYAGPTVFHSMSATPDSIPVAPTPVEGEETLPAETSTISVETYGTDSPTVNVQSPDLGATLSESNELTPGTTAGTVTVRAGDEDNYDEVQVTITEREEETSGETEETETEETAPEATPPTE